MNMDSNHADQTPAVLSLIGIHDHLCPSGVINKKVSVFAPFEMTPHFIGFLRVLCPFAAISVSVPAAEPVNHVPNTAPRTSILAGNHADFRSYAISGEGAAAFAKLRADFDHHYLALPFPDEPRTYGDPSPSKRTSEIADKWRDVQDLCGLVSGIAEAATLCWLVTGEAQYLAKAKDFLLSACRWHLAPDWKSGEVPGATDILYNDEGHFRLWRKLPLVFDQLRDQLTPEEKKIVLDHFRTRGQRSFEWIQREGNISNVARNSITADLSSHPIRFMPMTGLTGLALWDDLPEAREWWAFAYRFYRDQFTPWGGDDGGWAEGVAYWRGTIEHAFFQDALLAMGDPLAYSTPFWKNSAYFAVYNVQPYLATSFGDLANAGKFNLEPATGEYLLHLARVHQDGFLRSYADLQTDPRPHPTQKGLGKLDRTYPTTAEFIVRNFTAAHLPLPAARPMGELAPSRWFKDVGWVSLHSALGQPAEDIHLTFVSSQYGSFSHSHAQQNAFILNAYGEGLAVKSGFREWHNSPHHDQWVRQTKSMNALLIDGVGQKTKSKDATGQITLFQQKGRYVWTTGDATDAYATLQPKRRVKSVLRDVVFIDARYFVIRDRVKFTTPGKITWLLHTERPLSWQSADTTAFTQNGAASLTVKLIAPYAWDATITEGFPVAVDPRYVAGEANYSTTGEWNLKQNHLLAESASAQTEHEVFAVLWTEKNRSAPVNLKASLNGRTLTVARPDGKTDALTLSDNSLELESR